MERLAPRDARRLLDIVWELHAHEDPATFPQLLVRLIPTLVRSDITAYNEVDPEADRFEAVSDRPEIDTGELTTRLVPYVHEHPVIQHCQETGDETPLKISDFISRRQFHATGLYRNFYRLMNVEHQLALPILYRLPKLIAVTLNRERKDFSERDRYLCQLLQPHARQAYLRLRQIANLRTRCDDLESVLDGVGAALLVVDGAARIVRHEGGAREMLDRYFGGFSARRTVLPGPVVSWMQTERRRWTEQSKNGQPLSLRPWTVNAAEGRLRMHLLPRLIGGCSRLLLREHGTVAETRQGLAALGLSSREAEVMTWLLRGKANSEIGLILGISRRTVQKHLEHIFTRLGVENRTAAVALVSDHLRRV